MLTLALAGVILPIITQRLINEVAFGWSVRVLTFVILALALVAFAVICPRIAAKRFVPIQPRRLKDPTYVQFVVGEPTLIQSGGQFCCVLLIARTAFASINAALYVPNIFIQDYALGLGTAPSMALSVLSIPNAVTTVSRVMRSRLADSQDVPRASVVQLRRREGYHVNETDPANLPPGTAPSISSCLAPSAPRSSRSPGASRETRPG